jgi:hypothetical protein
MAIDRTGISSLDAGASDITYSGNEGPQDPRAMTDIEKIILQHWLQQGGSYGDNIPEEFKQQIIQIYGLDRDRSAEGGIARLGYANGQLVQPGLGRPGYRGDSWDDMGDWAMDQAPDQSSDTGADTHPGFEDQASGTARPGVPDQSSDTGSIPDDTGSQGAGTHGSGTGAAQGTGTGIGIGTKRPNQMLALANQPRWKDMYAQGFKQWQANRPKSFFENLQNIYGEENIQLAGNTGDIKRQGLSVDKVGYDTAQEMNAGEYKNWLDTSDPGQAFKSWNPTYASELLNALKDPTNIARGKIETLGEPYWEMHRGIGTKKEKERATSFMEDKLTPYKHKGQDLGITSLQEGKGLSKKETRDAIVRDYFENPDAYKEKYGITNMDKLEEIIDKGYNVAQLQGQTAFTAAEGGIARLGLQGGGPPGIESREPEGRSVSQGGQFGSSYGPGRDYAPVGGQHDDSVAHYTRPSGLDISSTEEKKDLRHDIQELRRNVPLGSTAQDYVDIYRDPSLGVTGEGGGGEGLGPTGQTPAEIEAMRIRQLLEWQEAQKEESNKMLATIKEQEEKDAFLASLTREYDFDPLEYGDDRGLMYGAYGGRVPAAYGGLMGNDGRRAYGLGSFFKSVTSLPKKAIRAVKKVAKSPIGKLALGYLATAGIGNIGAKWGADKGWGSMFGKDTGWLRPSNVLSNLGTSWSNMFPGPGITETQSNINKQLELAKKAFNENPTKETLENLRDMRELASEAVKKVAEGSSGGLGQTALKTAAWTLPAWAMMDPNFGAAKGLSMTDATGADKAATDAWAKKHLAGLTEEDWQLTPASEFTPLQYTAQGGRIGYKKGGDHTDRQLTLNMLSGIRSNAQEGGLMNLGGMEKDYRNDGGFVPIGGQERADDVPARLSKNEFVFTADAVRAAGGGDIDKGAEIMENVMENLEEGGNISQESQGLEGARNMFATSQRLEGVL